MFSLCCKPENRSNHEKRGEKTKYIKINQYRSRLSIIMKFKYSMRKSTNRHTGHGTVLIFAVSFTRREDHRKSNFKPTPTNLCVQGQLRTVLQTIDKQLRIFIHAQARAKALVRWATGERLTNHLPKLGLLTLPPPFLLNSGVFGLRMGPYVPSPKFLRSLGTQGE